MRVWIDVTNSPHVNFFAGLIRELEPEHEILITARPYANTLELLEQQGFDYELVGRHYGKSKIAKLLGFFWRCLALYRHLRGRSIDVAISQSSFFSPLVARLLGVPSIYMNDNEHAEGNRFAFLFATRILVPEFLSDAALRRQWARLSKVTRYPGVKEGIYLWSLAQDLTTTSDSERRLIVVRPEPWAAQYYRGDRNFLSALLLGLQSLGTVVLLPRDASQASHYSSEEFSEIVIPDTPITLRKLQESCRLFIGAGGTMTREAAVLGIPTISIYQDDLLSVDRFLVSCGVMVHNPAADTAYISGFLENSSVSTPHDELLSKGRKAYELVKDLLIKLGTRVEN